MRTLHLEIPRGLSFTLRGWEGACHHALEGAWRQIDLTFDFWPWLLHNERADLFGHLVDIHHYSSASRIATLRACERLLQGKSQTLEVQLRLAGVAFPQRALSSSGGLITYVRTTRDRVFFDQYFWHLCDEFMLLSGYSIVSLAIDSPDGLVFAALLADFIRRTDPEVRVCLTRHQYENYSLVHRWDDIIEDGSLFQLFDAIVHREENVGAALAGFRRFVKTGDRSALANVALRTDSGVLSFPAQAGPPEPRSPTDPRYVEDTRIPPDRLVYFTSLVRNACYYGRCRFCVQNERYFDPQGHKHAGELERTHAHIGELIALGVTKFSFSDQALHPNIVRAFARERVGKPRIEWCGRMLFDPRSFDDEMLCTLRESGCRELLFGVESFRHETLAAMQKDFGVTADAARALVASFERHGFDVVLSLIIGFPTESYDEFERSTLPLACELASRPNVTVILNRFALFRDTYMARTPTEFGITQLKAPTSPFAFKLEYVDAMGRESACIEPREAAARQRLQAASRNRFVAPEDRESVTCIDYSSIGLQYRWRSGRWLQDNEGRGNFGDSERDVLILGANSYLGQNLALALEHGRLVLSSKGARNRIVQRIDAPFLRADLVRGPEPLLHLTPREVYVLARPIGPFGEEARFAANLKTLFHAYAERHLRRVVFASTQLVYSTPHTDTALPSSSPVKPVGSYEYFKVEIERFLEYLVFRQPTIGVEIFRLPLLYGGELLDSQRGEQLIPRWVDDIRAGARWAFSSAKERSYGNSWVFVPDLVTAMTRAQGAGTHVRQPTSGTFTYAGLQEAVASTAGCGKWELPLVRSTFFLRNEEELPDRELTLASNRG